MTQTQKQRLEEAREIYWKAHTWMGYGVCDGEEDMLEFRKFIKHIERVAIKKYKKDLLEQSK